ncbi:unnamed protein product [Onchocerca flexuosa]|uniref:Uncharacterized protein n=1 Tax=Onchocerca flexuosa TaxID=387005 RepID=A0A183H5K8_9BILA|nr:unnamed protein product [Onchocerca flexuosa]
MKSNDNTNSRSQDKNRTLHYFLKSDIALQRFGGISIGPIVSIDSIGLIVSFDLKKIVNFQNGRSGARSGEGGKFGNSGDFEKEFWPSTRSDCIGLMMSRRCRIQARPNVIGGTKKNMPSKPKPASPIKAQSDDTSPLSATILISEKTLQETEISERGAVEVQELQFIPTISESISNDLNKAEADILMGKPSFVSDYTSESLMSLKSPEFIPKPQSSSPSKSPRPHSPLKSPVSVASSM